MITATVKRISMFGFYQDHLLACSFKLISCPNVNCAVKTTRQKLDEHVATVCEWRMVTCDHCSEPHPKSLLQVSFNDKEFAQMHGINKYTDKKNRRNKHGYPMDIKLQFTSLTAPFFCIIMVNMVC